MKHKKLLAAFLIAAVAVSSTGCYFFPSEEEMLEAPTIKAEDVTYSTFTAQRKTIISQTILTGYVASKTTTDCAFTSYTGNIKTVYVKAGDFVEEGELLAEFNNGTLNYELEIQRKKVELAQLNYNNSGSAADRLQLEIEQTTLDKYQAQYDGGQIYAPVAGQVSFVESLNPGDEVNPYKTIVRIVDPESLYVTATTDSRLYSVDDEVTINIGDLTYDGVIIKTPTEAMEEGLSNTKILQVDFADDAPSFAYLGSLADIVYVNSVSENAIVIPKQLVKTSDGRDYVQILRDNEKIECDVVTGISNATEIEIISGINEGDLVVVK